MKSRYHNYFIKNYHCTFTQNDIQSYRRWFYPQCEIIKVFIDKKHHKSYLKIGSGIGGFYQFINNMKIQYKSIELDANAANFANSYWKIKNFCNIALERMQTIEKFDLVFSFEVLKHLENPTKSIEKIYDLLNKKGSFVGTNPFPYSKNVLGHETRLSVLHPENWKRLFSLTSFKEVKLILMSFIPFLWRLNPKFNIRIPLYIPFPSFVSTCLIIAKK